MSNFKRVLDILKEEKAVSQIKAKNFKVTADVFKDDKGFYIVYPFEGMKIRLPKNISLRFKDEKEATEGLEKELNSI